MNNFQIQTFASIAGIGAASGIIYLKENLYLISDNSDFLYKFDIQNKDLYKFPLLENAQENNAKKDKQDFESMTFRNDEIIIHGSGSTKKRQTRVKFNLETKEIKVKDLDKLYDKLKIKASFTDDDLNLEGSFYSNEKLYLFNRGNSETAKNGIFVFDKSNDDLTFTSFNLPIINNVEATFTDAILVQNKIYFLACAENTTDTYNDGEIYGCIIGTINLENLELEKTIQISNNQKFEGLTLYENNENEIAFLLCEDNDTEELVSNIYLLKVNETPVV